MADSFLLLWEMHFSGQPRNHHIGLGLEVLLYMALN